MKQLLYIAVSINRKVRFAAILVSLSAVLLSAIQSSGTRYSVLMGPIQDISWTLDSTVNGVEFYHELADCGNSRKVLLRFVNKNSGPMVVTWKEFLTTRQLNTPTESAGGVKTLVLKPGETKAKSCTDTTLPLCVIDAGKAIPAYQADITGFSYKEITVSPD